MCVVCVCVCVAQFDCVICSSTLSNSGYLTISLLPLKSAKLHITVDTSLTQPTLINSWPARYTLFTFLTSRYTHFDMADEQVTATELEQFAIKLLSQLMSS